MSWKVRRAAAKCLGVILGSRPEMLSTFYQEVSPAIIKRFKGQLLSAMLVVVAMKYVVVYSSMYAPSSLALGLCVL